MRATIAAVGVLLLFGCAQSNTNAPTADLKSQIDANDAAWSAAVHRGDAAAAAAMYTETATMLPPGMPMQKGRAAIEKTVATIDVSRVRNLTLTAIDVSQIGPDTAREIGQYTLDASGPKRKFVKVEGKYVVIWKLVGGKWLEDVSIWNPNK